MQTINATGLRKAYSGTTVLDGINLSLNKGEAIALLGPNGAGKTTTIEILMGFVPRDGGEVDVLGIDPARESSDAWRTRTGMAVQVGRDHPNWRVAEILAWAHAHYPEGPGLKSVPELLKSFDLVDHANKRLKLLSGGLRRRVDLAIALVASPELLVLDEPTTGLDPSARRSIHDIVADQLDTGTSLLLTTHDLSEAERLADRILILNKGSIVAEGSAEELRQLIESKSKVTWLSNGTHQVHYTSEPEGFLRGLLRETGISALEVRRTSLEDAYLALVNSPSAEQSLLSPLSNQQVSQNLPLIEQVSLNPQEGVGNE